MQISIADKEGKWLRAAAAAAGCEVEALITMIVAKEAKKHPEYFVEDERELTDEQKRVQDLISFFKEMYQKRFAVTTDEDVDEDLVASVIKRVDEAIEEIDTTIDVIKKAIIWYIYQHKNEGQNGEKFPYKFRILLEQAWLLRSCIENSRGTDLALLVKAAERNLSTGDLSKAIRRGDLAGVESEDVTQMLEDALIEAEDVIEEFELDEKSFKKHPKMKGLYTSEIPSAETIRKAVAFLKKIREEYD